jgi:hypothetical protein
MEKLHAEPVGPVSDSLPLCGSTTECAKSGCLGVAAGRLSVLDLLQRAEAMCFGAAEVPTATGDGGVAADASLAVVSAVDDARMAFWDARGPVLKQRFSPTLVDKEAIFGYLLADVLGKSILAYADAKAVGKRGDNAVTKAKKERGKAAEASTRPALSVGRESGSDAQLAAAKAARESAIAANQALGAVRSEAPASRPALSAGSARSPARCPRSRPMRSSRCDVARGWRESRNPPKQRPRWSACSSASKPPGTCPPALPATTQRMCGLAHVQARLRGV